jgi:L-lactate dehydrogenase (cytochrome)
MTLSAHQISSGSMRETNCNITDGSRRRSLEGDADRQGYSAPQDAEIAVSLGVDGIIVSNHGGRQVEALPASIDALPAIVRQVGKRATLLLDSGVRSGSDIVRACALGASAAFAGKAFLWGFGCTRR